MSVNTLDLSATLAKAARHLAAFGTKGDLQDRNVFNFALLAAFKGASANPIATDAILHMIAQLGRRDPVAALTNLIDFSRNLSEQDNQEKIIILIDTLATPENIEALMNGHESFASAYRMQGMAARYLMDRHIPFTPDKLTRQNARPLIRIASDLLENQNPEIQKYREQAVRLLLAVIEHKKIDSGAKEPAFFILMRQGDEALIEKFDPEFIKSEMPPMLESMLFAPDVSVTEMGRDYKRLANQSQAGTAMAGLVQDYLPRVLAAIKAAPQENPSWTQESVAADLAKDIATGYGSNSVLKKQAFAEYEAYALKVLQEPQYSNTAYEDVKIQYAISLLKTGFTRGKAKILSGSQAMDESRDIILSTIEFAYTHRTQPAADSICTGALALMQQYEGLEPIARAVYERLAAKVFERERGPQILKRLLSQDESYSFLLRQSGLDPQISERYFLEMLRERLKKPLDRLMASAHALPYLDAAEGETFLRDIAKVSDQNPDKAWPVVKHLIERARYYQTINFPGKRMVAAALDGFLDKISRLSADNKQAALLAIEETALAVLPITGEQRARIESLFEREKPPIDYSHPAFAVRL